MKHVRNLHVRSLLLLALAVIFISFISCNQKKEKKDSTSYEGKTSGDTLTQTPGSNAQATPPQSVDTSSTTGSGSYTTPVVKKCDPSYTLLASPTKDQKIIYVTGFNPGEFKCWEELIKYGQKVYEKSSGVVYYVDFVNVLITSTPPDHVDEDDLAKHGIGKFSTNGPLWEFKGASVWGRKEKGYAYYNTNNAGGG